MSSPTSARQKAGGASVDVYPLVVHHPGARPAFAVRAIFSSEAEALAALRGWRPGGSVRVVGYVTRVRLGSVGANVCGLADALELRVWNDPEIEDGGEVVWTGRR